MRAVDSSLTAPPAPRQKFAAPAAPAASGKSDGGDFDAVMQSKLDQHPQKSAGRNPQRNARISPTANPDSTHSVTPAGEPSEPRIPASGKGTEDKAKSPATPEAKSTLENTPPDNSPTDSPQLSAPQLPAFFALPVSLANSFSTSIPAKALTDQSSAIESVALDAKPAPGPAGSAAALGSPKASADAVLPTTLPTVATPTLTAEAIEKLAPLDLAQNLGPQNVPAPKDAISAKDVLSGNDLIPAETAAAKPDSAPAAAKDAVEAPGAFALPAAAAPDLSGQTAEEPGAVVLAAVAAPLAASHADKALATDAGAAPAQGLQTGGTGVAITALSMKNPLKTNKVAGPDAKVLPVGQNGEDSEKNLPVPLLAAPVRSAENRGTDLDFGFAGGSDHTALAEGSPVINPLDLPSLTDARMRGLERAHDMIALHSMRLVESKSDFLTVVIKPSVGTELSLELRERDGGVEAQATLTRGDHQYLSEHWPELQHRLEQRGIRLSSLGGESNFSASDHHHFQQQQQSSQEYALQQASAFAEFAAVEDPGGATARLAAVHDGWESWA